MNRKYPSLRKICDTLVAMDKAESFRQTCKNFTKSQKNVLKGIRGRSPMINLSGFDIIEGFSPDYMHACLLGVGRRITEKLLAKLTNADIEHMGNKMCKFTVPHQLAQLPRSLTLRNLWKAKEWEAWILYYSVPVLSLKIKQKYVDYWCLFSNSLYTLLKTIITFEEIERVNKNLVRFVSLTEAYFGLQEMTFNLHQLIHLATSVYNWGPLFAHACFGFESSNHILVKAVKSANGVNVQITRFLGMSKCLNLLEKKLNPIMSDTVKNYYDEVSKYNVNDTYKGRNALYFGGREIINSEHLSLLRRMRWKMYDIISFKKALKDGILYSICDKNLKKTNNSYA